VITNGFYEDVYLNTVKSSSKFIITHTGAIYPGKRDPESLFKAVVQLKNDGIIFPNNFEIRFYGINSSVIFPMISKYDLDEFVKVYNFIPFRESILKQKESTILLLLAWNDTREWSCPAKIFEYMGAKRPILASAYKEGEITKLLKITGCGVVANEDTEIKNILINWMIEYKQLGRIQSYYSPNYRVINRYTRKNQTKKLSAIFNKVINTR
jgi:hypothetical protein